MFAGREKRSGPSLIFSLFLLLLYMALPRPFLLADDDASVSGRVLDAEGLPLAGTTVRIIDSLGMIRSFLSDAEGRFRLTGLPPGTGTLSLEKEGYHPLVQENLSLDPGQSLTVFARLVPSDLPEPSSCRLLRLDYFHCTYQTVLDPQRLFEYPSAHNVWSLVENQDLSATTNRIDVGGLWGTIPALFSARGGTSWTQTTYLLNGMDVTDPYQTGLPLFYPDFFALSATRLVNASPPPRALTPGGQFHLLTERGTVEPHGAASLFFIHDLLQSRNISPALRKEGLSESHAFNHSLEGNFRIGGPLVPEKLRYFTSFTASRISRNIADFAEDDRSSVISGLVGLTWKSERNTLDLLWTGQNVTHPSFGADRNVPFAATSNRKDLYQVVQALWRTRRSQAHRLNAGVTLAVGKINSDFQEASRLPFGEDVFRHTPRHSAPRAWESTRTLLTFLLEGEVLSPSGRRLVHRLQYGFQLQSAGASTSEKIRESLHLRFSGDLPLEVVKFNTPAQHREAALHAGLYLQDTIRFRSFFSLYLGLHLAWSKGWVPGLAPAERPVGIDWFNLSPRLGCIIPLSGDKRTAIKISAGRYYFTLPLHYLTYGNPGASGGLVHRWEDGNGDGLFQPEEQGILLRREGPFYAAVDPELRRPYTDELAASLEKTFGTSWHLSFGLFARETRRLVETVNTGVPFSAYTPGDFFDIGDDRIAGTHDDLAFIVYDQDPESLGRDFYLLTNQGPENRISKYYGADFTLVKKAGETFTFFLSLTATSATATTNPGNTHRENDEGVIGSLYDNPNTLINARGRVAFDRAYTGRVGFLYRGPWGIRAGCIIKYYDGQPFARKIIVTGKTQGPFIIQAHPRGVARYEYNRTVDLRLEKSIPLRRGEIRIILDGFNVLNRGLATEENEWTGPEFPLRYATEIQSPRVFRLGLVYAF